MLSRGTATAFAFLVVLMLCLVSNSGAGYAADVKILAAVAMKAPLDELFSQFEHQTGDKVTVRYGTAGEVRNRLHTSEAVDVVILPLPLMDQAAQQALVMPGSTVKLASTLVAMAVAKALQNPTSPPSTLSSERCWPPVRSPTLTRRKVERGDRRRSET